jgi:hypothetical protein
MSDNVKKLALEDSSLEKYTYFHRTSFKSTLPKAIEYLLEVTKRK